MSQQHPVSATIAVASTITVIASAVVLLVTEANISSHVNQITTQSNTNDWPRDICGIWKITYSSHNSTPIPAPPGHIWLFNHENKLLYWANLNDESAVTFKVIFTTATHRQLDLIPWEEEKVALRAIYEISEGKMRVCGGTLHGARPSDFDIKGADHHTTYLEQTYSPFSISE